MTETLNSSAILPLYYLPSIHWFNIFLKYNVWIEQHENFVKSTCRNRCEIAGSGGKLTLSIPLGGGRDHHRSYKDTLIFNPNDKAGRQSNWQSQHWQSIKSAYGSAPFFEFYCEKFEQFYEKPYEHLFDFNLDLLRITLAILKLKQNFILTETYQKQVGSHINLRTEKQTQIQLPRYHQVFEDKHGFISNLSILDLIFNEGPRSIDYLDSIPIAEDAKE